MPAVFLQRLLLISEKFSKQANDYSTPQSPSPPSPAEKAGCE